MVILTSCRDKADADQAIATMNGEWLGSRSIRVNWANQKTQTGGVGGAPGGPGGPPGPPYRGPPGSSMGGMPGMPSPMSMPPMPSMASPMHSLPHAPVQSYNPTQPLGYDAVASQTPDFNTTVYVGNLIPYTTQADLIPLFQGYGYIVEIRMQADRGFAFVKLDSHHNAALAISNLTNQLVHGRPIKCSWGKDKAAEGGATPTIAAPPQQAQQYPGVSGNQSMSSYSEADIHQAPMGYPNYNYYGGYQYGQTGIPGQPGQAAQQNGGAGQAQAGWDPAAAAAYYQSQGGWGNYYQSEY